jgi:hypothetical protein
MVQTERQSLCPFREKDATQISGHGCDGSTTLCFSEEKAFALGEQMASDIWK